MCKKRFFDLIFSCLGIIIFIPFFMVVALIIKKGSPGAIFYRGTRTGQFGKPFKIMKFRTMVSDAEQLGGGTTAFNDERITRIGHYLRKYKLDELPQLFNVLRGEMSLVGPRPELPCYTQKYTPEEQCILSVRPGITDFSSIEFSSLDQIVGEKNADQIFEKEVLPRKNALRIQYVHQQSFFLDVKLIFFTIIRIASKTVSPSGKK
jgi:lipopolysaccharide/colanic/teichoic acid biosynthesis glycosyltransferase